MTALLIAIRIVLSVLIVLLAALAFLPSEAASRLSSLQKNLAEEIERRQR